MNTEKKFYVTLNYVCSWNEEYNHTNEIPQGFTKFDTALQFAETIESMSKGHLTYLDNYSITWK